MAAIVEKQNVTNGTNGTKTHGPDYGLSSGWSHDYSPLNTSAQGRWEGELENLVVLGEVPKEIEGTFCRLIVDPHYPPHPANGFVEGDGNICALRFQGGRVDMKLKYVDTERWLLERRANERLFHIYRNPYSNHLCVRMATTPQRTPTYSTGAATSSPSASAASPTPTRTPSRRGVATPSGARSRPRPSPRPPRSTRTRTSW